MIGGGHHDRVLRQAALVQGIEYSAQVSVVMFDFNRVVEHVVADRFVVRPKSGNFVDVRQFLSRLYTASVFIPAMRFGRSEPKGPGSVFRSLLEELDEVGRVVVVGNGLCGRLRLVSRKRNAGKLARFAFFVPGDSRSPSFARIADFISVLGQGFDPTPIFGREKILVVGRFFQLPRVASGQDDGSGGGALGIRRVGPTEENAFAGHPIEGRGLHPFAAINSGMSETPIIGNGEQNIGAGVPFLGPKADSRKDKQNKKNFHGALS